MAEKTKPVFIVHLALLPPARVIERRSTDSLDSAGPSRESRGGPASIGASITPICGNCSLSVKKVHGSSATAQDH